jgi:uncharacterized protein with von Willebrand factor type A (vWA) domain
LILPQGEGGAGRAMSPFTGAISLPEQALLAPRVVEFCEELRREGVAVGTSEMLDAFDAVSAVDWHSPAHFREALATTVAKSQQDRHVFELVFERYFFRVSEAEQTRHPESQAGSPGEVDQGDGARTPGEAHGAQIDPEVLRQAIIEAIDAQDSDALRDLARLAIMALGPGEGSGVVGVDVQRIRRTLQLRAQDLPSGPDGRDQRDGLREFERNVRRELEAQQVALTGKLPPTRPLGELARALPTGVSQDLAAVERSVKMLKRVMASRGLEQRGHHRSGAIDVRHTMRASLETGGVPLRLKYRPRRPRRPDIYVLCDVSTSVTSASVFFLAILHALHDSFKRLRSFVFIERVAEVTDVFERERSFKAVSQRITHTAGVADISGYTDYGRVWLDFLDQVLDDLDYRSTVIVLGDARTNGRPAREDLFARIAEKAGRTFWLNPEPNLYWNYGDSVIGTYEPFCEVHECWTTTQLEEFVRALATVPKP